MLKIGDEIKIVDYPINLGPTTGYLENRFLGKTGIVKEIIGEKIKVDMLNDYKGAILSNITIFREEIDYIVKKKNYLPDELFQL